MKAKAIKGWYLYWNIWYLFREGVLYGWVSGFPSTNPGGLFPGQYCCDPDVGLEDFTAHTLELSRAGVQVNAQYPLGDGFDDHGFVKKLIAGLREFPREADLTEDLVSAGA